MNKHDRHPRQSGGWEQPLRRWNPWIPAVAGMAVLLLAGCQGSTTDAIFPGSLGHDPPPAIGLPPQDAGMDYR
jgi:hypothetical protein